MAPPKVKTQARSQRFEYVVLLNSQNVPPIIIFILCGEQA